MHQGDLDSELRKSEKLERILSDMQSGSLHLRVGPWVYFGRETYFCYKYMEGVPWAYRSGTEVWLFSVIMHSGTVQEKLVVEKDSDLRSQFINGPSPLLKGLALALYSIKVLQGSNLQNPNKTLDTGLRSRSGKVRDQSSPGGKYSSSQRTGRREAILKGNISSFPFAK